jgi:hypothetical protein
MALIQGIYRPYIIRCLSCNFACADIYMREDAEWQAPECAAWKKAYLKQEIEAVILTGKPQKRALEAVKTQSLQNRVLHKFHNLNNHEISHPIQSLTMFRPLII